MFGFWRLLFVAAAIGLAAFSLWSAGPGIAEDQVLLGVYTAVTWALLFLGRPAREHAPWVAPGLIAVLIAIVFCGIAVNSLLALDRVFEDGATIADYIGWALLVVLFAIGLKLPRTLDLILAGITLCIFSYYMIEYLPLVDRAGAWTPSDTSMSVVAVVIAIEVARRGIGLWIPGIAVAMLCYAHFGDVFPEAIAHRGIDLARIFNYAFYSQEGIFGVMTTVMANTVLVFILLGAFMNQSGMGRFFIDFPLAIAGRSAGGPAKVAVIASAIFGSISGSSLANIVSTGTFTIPLMRKVGFSRNVAGAVENTASLGGQLLPPVMGAGVFVMAEITGVPYTEIIAVAAIPALLYMASIILIVHFQAKREGIARLEKDQVPVLAEVLRDGWFHLVPFVILIGFLIGGYSPDWCAVMAIASIVVINWARVIRARLTGTAPPDEILGISGIAAALRQGVENSLAIGAAAACVGIIVGMFALTGLGLKISVLFVDFSQGSLMIALLLIAITSLIMGHGATDHGVVPGARRARGPGARTVRPAAGRRPSDRLLAEPGFEYYPAGLPRRLRRRLYRGWRSVEDRLAQLPVREDALHHARDVRVYADPVYRAAGLDAVDGLYRLLRDRRLRCLDHRLFPRPGRKTHLGASRRRRGAVFSAL